jgi:hypothetical protein
MAPDVLPADARLDAVERGLEAIEAALARLDAGEVDDEAAAPAVDEIPADEVAFDEVPAGDVTADEHPNDDPAEPDAAW